MKFQISPKRIQINKAQTRMLVIMGAASVLTVFSLMGSKALISQSNYQRRVINERQKASKQLKNNIKSVDELVAKYRDFDAAPENVLGGNSDPSARGERDGPNSRLVLDALPSKYDFPAVATSLEKILVDGGYKIQGIVGTDDEVNQSKADASSQPEAVEIPFIINAGGSYASVQKLIADFERSIRPIRLTGLDLSGNDANMNVSVQAKTYYQPEKNLEIRKKVMK